jgi:hypothetical protein
MFDWPAYCGCSNFGRQGKVCERAGVWGVNNVMWDDVYCGGEIDADESERYLAAQARGYFWQESRWRLGAKCIGKPFLNDHETNFSIMEQINRLRIQSTWATVIRLHDQLQQ